MERPRVLIVEDRPSVLKLLATILEDRYEVTTAVDGATALSIIDWLVIDVVLTDIRMPGASGFDLLRMVQSRAPRAAVVMMTADAKVQDAVAAMKLGAFDYVGKPLDADEIALVVARAVEHVRERAEAEEGPGGAAPRTDSAGARARARTCWSAINQGRRPVTTFPRPSPRRRARLPPGYRPRPRPRAVGRASAARHAAHRP